MTSTIGIGRRWDGSMVTPPHPCGPYTTAHRRSPASRGQRPCRPTGPPPLSVAMKSPHPDRMTRLGQLSLDRRREWSVDLRVQYQVFRPPMARPVAPRIVSTAPTTIRMIPIVQRIGMPNTKPSTSRMIPKMIMLMRPFVGYRHHRVLIRVLPLTT